MKSLLRFFKLADRAKMLFLVLVIQTYSYGQSTADFDLIMDRIYHDFQSASGATLDAEVDSLSNAMRSDYSWSDIPYSSTAQGNWLVGKHLDRLGLFAKAYANPSSAFYGKADLKQKIEGGMNYWLGLNPAPSSTNWFYLTISVPKSVGNLLICLRKSPSGISSTLESQMLAWMTKGYTFSNSTVRQGSNLTDVAQHYIMRACLTQNETLLKEAVTQVNNSILIGSSGIQKDNSYLAHGPQLYIYGYGNEYISGISNVASWVVGTSFAFPADKIAIFSNFVRKGFIKPSRGAYADFNLFGRGVTRKNAGKANPGLLEKVKAVDISANSGAYDDAIQRMRQIQPASYNILSEHIHYWRSDYSLHLSPNYTFGLRNVSTRTQKSETGNGENLKGYYLTEGVNYIAVNGDEYFNIFPVWDWNKIPGTTVPEITSYPKRTDFGTYLGKSSFVGGVSDGVYGASAYAMNDYNTTAKKSWFFFDEEIVCLGAGIASGAAQNINTALNQCLLKTDVTIADGSGNVTVLSKGGRDYDSNLKWVLQGNVGYFFPKGGKVSVSNQTQTGDWSKINSTIASETVSADVFKLWFKHGLNPSNANYAYIVTPGKTSASQMQAYNGNNISILANDSTMQGVRHNVLGVWQIVFYRAGEFQADGVLVKVDQPCVVMLKNVSTSTVVVHIADPTQQAKQIHLGLKTAQFSEMKSADMTMPTGFDAGSSVSTTITPSSPLYEAVRPVGSVSAIADAFVRNGSYANVNYGQETILTLKKDATGYTREAFIKFDLASIPASMDSVLLHLKVSNANTSVAKTKWVFYLVENNSWTETGINWTNKPGHTTRIGELTGRGAGSTLRLNITATVLGRLSADKLLTIHIVSEPTTTDIDKTDANFNSRESSVSDDCPRLLVYSQSSASARSGQAVVLESNLTTENPLFTVGPNPASDFIHVFPTSSEPYTVTMIDSNGKQLQQKKSATSERITFDLGPFPAGTYFITADGTNNRQQVARFLILK
ncbi:DNRLRE domain-containing protein [Spirosoma aureum]|uniref:DNRLRE domain-containing protein n=1 Tax=Spirosoma aureum TaxID=2692134 RepID=A0A6G9AIM1_9BACT|nr:polysaccharide lyase family 8 super-sandwich domain-containing protein [Spirosoma aureum]QIP12322.1 DNRLRE domain-containing protein [Spirosoma aureum]